MPEENDTAWPPSSPPRTSSKASQVSVASVRLYRRSVPSTKFEAGTSGVFRGAPGTRSGRPPTMAQVSGFISAYKNPRSPAQVVHRREVQTPDERGVGLDGRPHAFEGGGDVIAVHHHVGGDERFRRPE